MVKGRTILTFSLFLIFACVAHTDENMKCDAEKLKNRHALGHYLIKVPVGLYEPSKVVKATKVASFTFFEPLPGTNPDSIYNAIREYLKDEAQYNLVFIKEQSVFVLIDTFGGEHAAMERILLPYTHGNSDPQISPVIRIIGGTRLTNYDSERPTIVESLHLQDYGSGIEVHDRVLQNLVIEEVKVSARDLRTGSVYQGGLAQTVGYRVFEWEMKKKGKGFVIIGTRGELL